MERTNALFFAIVTFLIFAGLTYYGVGITLWSSFAFSVFVSLVIMNIFYPPKKMATDNPDFTLGLYALFQIVGLLVIAVYVAQKSLTDLRPSSCNLFCV